MILLVNVDTAERITRFVSLKEKQEVIRTTHTTLDGREIISRYGEPITTYELTVYVSSAGKQALLQAEDNLSLLRVTLRERQYMGRIVKLSDFERISSKYWKATVSLAKEVAL